MHISKINIKKIVMPRNTMQREKQDKRAVCVSLHSAFLFALLSKKNGQAFDFRLFVAPSRHAPRACAQGTPCRRFRGGPSDGRTQEDEQVPHQALPQAMPAAVSPVQFLLVVVVRARAAVP